MVFADVCTTSGRWQTDRKSNRSTAGILRKLPSEERSGEAVCRDATGRRERLPLHLLVEHILGLGPRERVPVGYGVRKAIGPRRGPRAGVIGGGRGGRPRCVRMFSSGAGL